MRIKFIQNFIDNIRSKNKTKINISELKSCIDTLKDELAIYKLKDKKNNDIVLENKTSEVNIGMITDEYYVTPTIVAMTSAIYNKNSNSIYNFYLILNNVQQDFIEKFKQLEQKNVNIFFIKANTSRYQNIIMHSHVKISACLKFDLSNLLNIDKVLYLDGDILVNKDLSELYNKDISDYYCAGVRDMGGELGMKFNSQIGIKEYFNSGVLLLNLKKIREENLSKRFIEIKLSHPQWICMDQDTLNYVMAKNTMWLDVKYNCMLPLYNNPFYAYETKDINSFYGCEYKNKIEMEYDAVIIHFAGEPKSRPWECKNGTYQKIWDYYYNISPCKI